MTPTPITTPEQALEAENTRLREALKEELAKRASPARKKLALAMGKAIIIRGVEYPSVSDAGRTLGVTRQAINLTNRRGSLNTVGLLSARIAHAITPERTPYA